jgi:hypothetical protein
MLSKPDAIQANILSENGRRCDNTLDKKQIKYNYDEMVPRFKVFLLTT